MRLLDQRDCSQEGIGLRPNLDTRNGLMLMSHIHHLMKSEGVTDIRQAVHRGALERLSPILMTALSAGLALIPLALAIGKPGSEIQTPMAIVILRFGSRDSEVK
ncbi:MAG: efflux RND transporter permease subunit [Acidobacteriota bacterium]